MEEGEEKMKGRGVEEEKEEKEKNGEEKWGEGGK